MESDSKHGICGDCLNGIAGIFSDNHQKMACCFCGETPDRIALLAPDGNHRVEGSGWLRERKLGEPLCGYKEE